MGDPKRGSPPQEDILRVKDEDVVDIEAMRRGQWTPTTTSLSMAELRAIAARTHDEEKQLLVLQKERDERGNPLPDSAYARVEENRRFLRNVALTKGGREGEELIRLLRRY